jgi:hypothetical protein
MAEYLKAYVVEGLEQPIGIREKIYFPLYDSSTYDAIRQVLRPEYRNLSDAEIDALLQRILRRMSPAEVEGFWDTVKDVAGQLLPVAGAAVGTYFGGPAGTAIGAQLGQTGAQLIRPQKPATRAPAPAAPAAAPAGAAAPAEAPPGVAAPEPAPAAPAAPPPTAAPAAAPIPPGGTSAVAQLMSLIQNPAFLKSLLSQVLGPGGQPTVPVGSQGTPVSFGPVLNALTSLAGKAAEEAAEAYPGAESVEATAYLVDPSGNFLVDPADPDARAQRLLELLQEDYQTGAYEPGRGAFDPVTEWLIEANLVK